MAIRAVVLLLLLATAFGADAAHRKLRAGGVDTAVGVNVAFGANVGNRTIAGNIQKSSTTGDGKVVSDASATTPPGGKDGFGVAATIQFAVSAPDGKGGKINIAGGNTFANGNNGGTYTADTTATAGGASASGSAEYDGSGQTGPANTDPVQTKGVNPAAGSNNLPITVGGGSVASSANTYPRPAVTAGVGAARNEAASSTSNNIGTTVFPQTARGATSGSSGGVATPIVIGGKSHKSSGITDSSSNGITSGNKKAVGSAADKRGVILAALHKFFKPASGK